jgi:hypothetical protein
MFMVCDDGTLSEDCPLSQWARHMMDASAKLGAGFDGGSKYKQYLIDAGFEDVVEVTYKWPINTWPKDAKHKEIGTVTSSYFLPKILLTYEQGPGIWRTSSRVCRQ